MRRAVVSYQCFSANCSSVPAEIENGVWVRGEVYAAGRRWATYASSTTFPYTDQVGTLRANGGLSGVAGTCLGLPFGDGEVCTGSSPTVDYFTGKPRDPEGGGTSDLDYFGARYNSSMLGRFTTPDPLGGHPQNPQTLNKYAYAANNPVTLTDPSGLDFNLTCSPSSTNQTTCHGGVQGTTTEGKFTATVISSTAIGTLTDQYGNAYKGTFNGTSVTFTNAAGAPSTGSWIQGSSATTGITGGGALSSNFNFTFSDHGNGQLLHATFTYRGDPVSAANELEAAGFRNTTFLDNLLDPEHKAPPGGFLRQFRTPGAAWTGAGSSHAIIELLPNLTVPTLGTIHTGEHNPHTGFGLYFHCVDDKACN